jgi:hypothetical protein
MGMRLPTNYFELVEGYVQAVELLGKLSEAEVARASRELLELSLMHLRRDGGTSERHEKLAIWHADKFYRLVNQVDALNASSLLFMRSVGAAFEAVSKERGLWVAYLVDNQIPDDRLRGVHAAFSSLGFLVCSPELFVPRILEVEPPGTRVEQVYEEAAVVAMKMVNRAIESRKNVLWISADVPLDGLQHVAEKFRGLPYVGVFRNEAPADGSNVQTFQAGGRVDPLTAKY